MKLKDGVKLEGVHWRMFHAAIVAEEVFENHGSELVITSAKDGKHKDGSLHYQGKALDLRTWNIAGREGSVIRELQRALGNDFDIVLEKDHIHLEYDPEVA
jgi:hypothetical protein